MSKMTYKPSARLIPGGTLLRETCDRGALLFYELISPKEGTVDGSDLRLQQIAPEQRRLWMVIDCTRDHVKLLTRSARPSRSRWYGPGNSEREPSGRITCLWYERRLLRARFQCVHVESENERVQSTSVGC